MKSNSAYLAINAALEELDNEFIFDIPSHIKDAHYNGASNLDRGIEYKYPHDYKNNYVKQQYLPDSIKNSVYYIPSENKTEKNIKNYLDYLNSNK